MKKIEILAPAGSYESLVAAINAYCDAVYIGGSKFGARAYANNLSEDDMLKAIDYTHIHDKKIYLTVNTLLKNNEVENDLFEYIRNYYERGLDAVIVQDLGVLNFIHQHFPQIEIHASTQMTLTMGEGTKAFENMGVTRLVTSRELSLQEIKDIRKKTDLEIESFVHGALCYCYSGQCLFSSMLGGRSGNRGRCAQPCRMPYDFYVNGKKVSEFQSNYLLSPKDICTISIIPELVEAGIDSFKIEGRMKRPEYTAYVSSVYRYYVDKYLELGLEGYRKFIQTHKNEFLQHKNNLMDLYNRGSFTTGYYESHNGKPMMALNRPNHNGVFVGKVSKVDKNLATIQLETDVNAQDVLEIRNNNEKVYEFTLKNPSSKGSFIETKFFRDSNVKVSMEVYRTKNSNLLDEIKEKFIDEEIKVPLVGTLIAKVSEPLTLHVSNGKVETTVYGDMVDEAKNQPMTKEKIINQLSKTNMTSYAFQSLDVVIEGNVFIPVGKLNEIRRLALDTLSLKIAESYRRISEVNTKLPLKIYNKQANKIPNIFVTVTDKEQFNAAILNNEIDSICIVMAHFKLDTIQKLISTIVENNKNAYVMLPHILRRDSYEKLRNYKNIFIAKDLKGIIIKNLESYSFLTEEFHEVENSKEVILDYNMYVLNHWSEEFWLNKGISRFTTSVELNYQELKEFKPYGFDMVVYGHLPLMVSAQCIKKNTIGCTKEESIEILRDRLNKDFYVRNVCDYCYNLIYNSQPMTLLNEKEEVFSLKPKNIRLDFTFETADEMNKIINSFAKRYKYNKKVENFSNETTRGHFKRGIE